MWTFVKIYVHGMWKGVEVRVKVGEKEMINDVDKTARRKHLGLMWLSYVDLVIRDEFV
jgi:hypothetical protein